MHSKPIVDPRVDNDDDEVLFPLAHIPKIQFNPLHSFHCVLFHSMNLIFLLFFFSAIGR